MTISISGQVPAKAQNGMYELEDLWTDERTPQSVYAVVKLDRAGLKFDDAKQEWSATMKLSHVEPVSDPTYLPTIQKIMDEAAFERGGAVLADTVELDIPEGDAEPDPEPES